MAEAGYHLKEIPKGTLGEWSKIREEFLECEDALEQKCQIMIMVELSDLLGAIDFFLEKRFEGKITREDLNRMSYITKRAFISGARSE